MIESRPKTLPTGAACRAIAATIAAIAVCSWASHGAAQPAQRGITIAGSAVESLSEGGVLSVLDATVSDGIWTVRGPKLVVMRLQRKGLVEGGFQATGPDGTLRGQTLQFQFTAENRLTVLEAIGRADAVSADRRVTAGRLRYDTRTSAAEATEGPVAALPDGVRVTGSRIRYDAARRVAEATGNPVVRFRDGMMRGGDAIVHQAEKRAVVDGPVRVDDRQATATADRATVYYGEKRAVLEGSVRVDRGGSTMRAARVELWYASGRVRAEDASRIVIDGALLDGPPR